MLSVYVVCWIFLQTFQTYFCIQANSVDPDQTAPRGAVWSWSTLFAKKRLLKSQADDNCCDWQFKGWTVALDKMHFSAIKYLYLFFSMEAYVLGIYWNCFADVMVVISLIIAPDKRGWPDIFLFLHKNVCTH